MIFEFSLQVDDILAASMAYTCGKIAARSCLKALGAGGIRQTAKAPVNLRILGGFAIYVDGGVDGFLLYRIWSQRIY